MNKSAFFLLNHTAHIYHVVSIAFELSMLEKQAVTIYTSTKRNLEIIKKLAVYYPDHSCNIILFEPSSFYKTTRKLKKRDFPGFHAIFSRNKKLILEHDNLISPADEILQLKKDKNFSNKNFIYTKHGSGNFSYDFSDRNDAFDVIFLSGDGLEKNYVDEKRRQIGNLHAKYEVVGYPKFDLCRKTSTHKKLFNNNKPTVVYIPHFKENYSSWYLWGEKILEFFINTQDFNLIFAPHVLMPKSEKHKIKQKYLSRSFPNIHIDVDDHSESLINMDYTFNADIYLGDVSSQVYEFLIKERPCIFLNTHQEKWQESKDTNFDSWHLGHVIENDFEIENMKSVIESSQSNHHLYLNRQQEAVQNRFSFINENASLIAAKVISRL